jgi:hypothetical protein
MLKFCAFNAVARSSFVTKVKLTIPENIRRVSKSLFKLFFINESFKLVIKFDEIKRL